MSSVALCWYCDDGWTVPVGFTSEVDSAACASCQVILVSANKLTRYIEPCQLTDDFGGSLDYDHNDWLNKRLVSISL